jgi:predicted DNA-binding transcriptional regulator YafY
MRRADRLFDIIQALRVAKAPLTAADLAMQLEVTVRTVYRDIATLQARRVPIEGAVGLGYMLRQGFDLPPLMFTLDEIDAILVGAQLIQRTGDAGLQAAARSVLSKVTVALPDHLRHHLDVPPIYVSPFGASVPSSIDLNDVRQAIRGRQKMAIDYVDGDGIQTKRVIWPLAVAYFIEATLVCGWCELRRDYRHFRADRIKGGELLAATYPADDGRLLQDWLTQVRQPQPDRTRDKNDTKKERRQQS